MSDASVLEFFEIVEHSLAEGSLVVAKLGIFVFQINSLSFVELVIEEITVGESDLDHRRVMRRKFQSLERRCYGLTGLSIEEVIPGQG